MTSRMGSSGSGLGLPIVAGILRDNDAAAWIDSSPGDGTTVTVAWPSEPNAPRDFGVRTVDVQDQSDLAGHKILVVDDIPDVADVLAAMLETAGAVAVTVSDPQEAAELLRENPGLWSALVTDLDMPGLRGTDLARTAAACCPAVPVVLVTALAEEVASDAEHFHAILSKPIEAADLIASVRTAVSTRLGPSGPRQAAGRVEDGVGVRCHGPGLRQH